MEWDPRKSRLTLATYVFCFIAIVLSLVILLVLAAVLMYYTSVLTVALSNRSLLRSSYLGTAGEAGDRQPTTKPNIILITADDLVNRWN